MENMKTVPFSQKDKNPKSSHLMSKDSFVSVYVLGVFLFCRMRKNHVKHVIL